eukprot:TRINITY_DN1449_c0_g1_i4.p1 TRINITY_DN1449_c0_g1~~TRINITY_DN1449_c0_g1_i4.p1  ORF type:complete len:347 (+),score=55.69 TRINITY_DN1449_c0_g1_i4:413-1453(+)
MMLRILLIHVHTFTEMPYHRGMQQLLGLIVHLLESEKLEYNETDPLTFFLDARFVENDCYHLFRELMKHMCIWFTSKEVTDEKVKNNNPISKCQDIINVMLKEKDPVLYHHFRQINLEPQIYTVRWIRELFSREFNLDHVLVIWDGIFAHANNMEIIPFICLIMLIRIRPQLLNEDLNGCLRLLFNYPLQQDLNKLIPQARLLLRGCSHDGKPALIKKMTTTSDKTDYLPQPNSRPTEAINTTKALPLSIPRPQSTLPGNTQPCSAQVQNEKQSSNPMKRELVREILQMKKMQTHMAVRIEPIVESLQHQLQVEKLSESQADVLCLAIANLKQVKDVLSGNLPDSI